MDLIHWLENTTFFDIQLLNSSLLGALVFRFLFNLLIVYIIVRKVYYPLTNNKDYLFSFFLVNVLIFFVCFLMNHSQLEIGIGFGLFAIFSIFRYRADAVSLKEMTYLFAVVIVAVINAISSNDFSYTALIFTNFAIVGLIWFMEKVWLIKYEATKVVNYEKIENITPQRRQILIDDLRQRTGLDIHRVHVGRIDFLR